MTEVEVTASLGLFYEVRLFIGKRGVLRIRKGTVGRIQANF